MSEIGRVSDIAEIPEQKTDVADYKNIHPEGRITPQESRNFWNNLFSSEIPKIDNENVKEKDNSEEDLEKNADEYFDDLRSKSDYPETIQERPFETSELEKVSPEEVAEKRGEFDDKKAELKKEWEEENGRPWPKYEHDVYSSNGKLIRKAGSDYDAHHIQPLGMGGKNEVSNITPLHAEVHYDKQGVHAPDSPYIKLDKMLGGKD